LALPIWARQVMRFVGGNLDVQTLPRAFFEILKPNWMWYKNVVGIFKKGDQMNLGQFSMSLAVKNLSVSMDFYETLGFMVFGGAIERNYLIMKQADTLIGLFQDFSRKRFPPNGLKPPASSRSASANLSLIFSPEF
jgi:hypothetical protein